MKDVLTPELYEVLQKRFKTVKIANQGRKSDVVKTTVVSKPRLTLISDDRAQKSDLIETKIEVRRSGEYYRVNCPFCGDTEYRLWIHYLYLQYPHLCICYRRRCTSNYLNRKKLQRMLLIPGRIRAKSLDVETFDEPEVDERLEAVTTPGLIVPLTSLPADDPVNSFLKDERQFDPEYLVKNYQIGWCHSVYDQSFMTLADKIYIPVVFNGMLVGWQGRAYDDFTKPKYYLMPGMKKSLVMYNFDVADTFDDLVICEGVTDVWRVGPQGVAVFGHTLSQRQIELLIKRRDRGSVALCFDSDDPDAIRTSKDLEVSLKTVLSGRIFRVELPIGSDPGSLTSDTLWSHILRSSEQSGVKFARRS